MLSMRLVDSNWQVAFLYFMRLTSQLLVNINSNDNSNNDNNSKSLICVLAGRGCAQRRAAEGSDGGPLCAAVR